MEDNNTDNNKTLQGTGLPEDNVNQDQNVTLLRQFLSWLGKKAVRKDMARISKRALRVLIIVLSVSALVAAVFYGIPLLGEIVPVKAPDITPDPGLNKSREYKSEMYRISRDIQRLEWKYNSNTSGQSYIVINTTDNRFYLYRNKKMIREGFCSSGSYTLLKTETDRKWIFKTPKGKYWVRGKTTNPVWKRPDWSFVEEGLPIPPKDDNSRYEYGVLGDYALSIGDGYLIHGTIYKRFLGMPVTHGCVRLNDDDLKAIFNTLSVGSKVYIF